MKNKKLVISLIIILSILVVGLIILFIGLLTNKITLPFFKVNLNYRISENLIVDNKYENVFSTININSSISNIEIKQTNNNQIALQIYGSKDELNLQDTNNTLDISYKENGCKGLCFNEIGAKIIIYIPANFANKINITNDYGKIYIGDLSQVSLNIEAANGDLKINKIASLELKADYLDIEILDVNSANITADCSDIEINKIADANINSDLGDIEIKNLTNYIDLRSDCGDIEIENLNIGKDSSIENNLGDITIDYTNDIYIDSQVDLGQNEIARNNRLAKVTLKIYNDCGDVEVG